jgi:hypothetical protein
MAWLHQFWLRVKALLRRQQLDRDLQDELQFHLTMREQKRQSEGLAAAEARTQTRREFGNASGFMETCRELWTFTWLETLWQDLKYGIRMLRRSPAFTAVAVLSLTLGIGVNAAFFCLVNALLLKPLPVPNPEQLVRIQIGAGNNPYIHLTCPMFQAIRKQGRLFSEVAGWSGTRFLLGPGINGRFVSGVSASGSYFAMLGIDAQLGRTFTEEDDQAGSPLVAVLSHDLWMREFQADPGIIGQTIHLNGMPFTVGA